MTEAESVGSQSKKASCQLAKFHYHLGSTIPELFQEGETGQSRQGPILQCRRGVRGMTYYFADHSTEGVSSLDGQAIMESAKKLYMDSECVRVGSNSFRRVKDYKVPYLPLYGRFQEVVEFHLVDKNEATSTSRSRPRPRTTSTSKAKEVEEETVTAKQPPNIKLPNNFELYVVHHCHADPKEEVKHMRWENVPLRRFSSSSATGSWRRARAKRRGIGYTIR
jgi:hypothetical protein